MATATLPDTMDVEIDCTAPSCEGKGYVEIPNIRIDPKYIDRHLKQHAYVKLQGERSESIGSSCDCPRVIGKPTKLTCQACQGTGRRHAFLTIPKKGARVKVLDPELLEQIFGDDIPEGPGRVYDSQTPEEHRLELRSGIGVRVTWDKLTQSHNVPKGKQVELWTFDLLELEIVR